MAKIPSAAIAAGGLVGGYGVARWTKKRPLGGVVLLSLRSAPGRPWSASPEPSPSPPGPWPTATADPRGSGIHGGQAVGWAS